MYERIIGEFITNLTEIKMKELAKTYDIKLSDEEIKILYVYAKNYWKIFLKGKPNDLIAELKAQINPESFNKLYSLYLQNVNRVK